MGNQGMNMCCNNAYVNKQLEVISPEMSSTHQLHRVRLQDNKENQENVNPNKALGHAYYEGEMHITDRKDNDLLVKHIRTTSLINKSNIDFSRVKDLALAVASAPKLQVKVLSSGK